jgi:cytochrome c
MLGRKAGTVTDFRYSPAMRNSGITRTPQTLETFIADPQKTGAGQPNALCGIDGRG